MSDLAPFTHDSSQLPAVQQPQGTELFRPEMAGFDWEAYEHRQEQLDVVAQDVAATRAVILEIQDQDPNIGLKLNNLHNRELSGEPIGNLSARLSVLSRSIIRMGLPGLDFRGGVAVETTFAEKNDLRGADFTDSVLPRVDFTGADLTGVSFVNAIMNGAKFEGANLQNVDFTGAYLVNVAGLTSAQLRSATLDGARVVLISEEVSEKDGMLGTLASHFGELIPADQINRTDPVPVALEGTQVAQLQANKAFRGLYGNRLVLNGVDFTRTRLHGLTLVETVARGIVLRGAQLSGATVLGTEVTSADMRDADMHSMWAPGSLWEDVDLRGAYVAKANLAGSVFRRVDFTDVRGLDTPGTNLEGAIFEDCRLPKGFKYNGFDLVLPKSSDAPSELSEGESA